MSKALLNPELSQMIHHAVGHARDNTTELAEGILTLPAGHYTDPGRHKLEVDRIFRRLPLVLAASCELPNAGDYKTMDVTGVPVLLVRGQDGAMRAFLNSCSHRGASVATEACGNTKRFTCQYHGWTYDQKGQLIGVASPKDFGEIDKSCHGLKALPVAERAGLVFVTLNTNSGIDIDDFLSGIDHMLELFQFKDWHFFANRQLPSANWKLAFEATIEYYHVPALHKNTLAAGGEYSNRALYYYFGPHQRLLNPDSRIRGLADIPEGDWDDTQVLAGNWSIFPCVTLAAFNGGFVSRFGNRRAAMIMQILPGETPGTSWTNQIYLLEKKPDDESATLATAQFEMLGRVVEDEDNEAGYSQQKAFDAGLKETIMFGRNEGGLQAFHKWIDKIIAADDQQVIRMFKSKDAAAV